MEKLLNKSKSNTPTMHKINQIIDEIRTLKTEPSHKSALRISNLLENNKKEFLAVVEAQDFRYLLLGFENLSYKNPQEFKFGECINEYNQLCENFLFHCTRLL